MEGESCVTRSIIAERHSSNIQGDELEGESCVFRSINDELHSSDIQREQMGSEGGVVPSIIDELYFSDRTKWKVKVVLLEVSLMNFTLGTSKEIKYKVKEWCCSKYHG